METSKSTKRPLSIASRSRHKQGMSPLTALGPPYPREAWSRIRADLFGLPALPIRGGWGYSQEDACLIECMDADGKEIDHFAAVAIEREFVRRRLVEELIVRRNPGDAFWDMRWNILVQTLHTIRGRRYDRIVYQVSAIPQVDWSRLQSIREGKACAVSDQEGFGEQARAFAVRFEREYWFDVTGCFGNHTNGLGGAP